MIANANNKSRSARRRVLVVAAAAAACAVLSSPMEGTHAAQLRKGKKGGASSSKRSRGVGAALFGLLAGSSPEGAAGFWGGSWSGGGDAGKAAAQVQQPHVHPHPAQGGYQSYAYQAPGSAKKSPASASFRSGEAAAEALLKDARAKSKTGQSDQE